MRAAPSLHADPQGPPWSGRLYAVRYTDVRGQSVTALYRVRGAAERFAARVADRGGSHVIYRTELERWSR